MAAQQGLRRKAHFLGTKIRSLRKRNRLTLEDLSVRCVQMDPEAGPSVSYLSMIENGKRVPSERLLDIIAEIFQKDTNWFFDESLDDTAIDTAPAAPVNGMPLEPGFLFSESLLQLAIPELLAQTGTTGRQFAHLLIRAHQEQNQNRFPDIERAAERVGRKHFPMHVDDVFAIASDLGLNIQWFDNSAFTDKSEYDRPLNTLVRSFFDAPDKLYLNRELRNNPARLKYDLANQIGHKVLHDGDGARAPQMSGPLRDTGRLHGEDSMNVDARDILYAWRDFECSYFAAALLAPKTPFRQFLARNAYSISSGNKADLTSTLVMRRMSSVSPYPYWHYFDAYPPGNLRAVYRGNGIPLPWGNMTLVSDPCQHWAVFRMLNTRSTKPAAQISVLRSGDDKRLYCCESVRSKDAAGNTHVLCAGVDLAPALRAQNIDAQKTIDIIEASCNRGGGSAPVPTEARKQLESIGKILNIGWISEGATNDATIICQRSSSCPRDKHCLGKAPPKLKPQIEKIREALVNA